MVKAKVVGTFIQEVRGFLRGRLTPAVRVLFVTTIAIFLAQWIVLWHRPFAVIPRLLECRASDILGRGFVWQLVTYAFLHGSPLHLLGNMLFLWFLGPLVERRIGTTAFYRVYFMAAFVGGLSHVGMSLLGLPPLPMIGASGAVMAVAVICAIYHFHMLIYLMGVWPIRLGYLIIILLVMDALYLLGPSASSGVANYAHLAGAAVGWAYVKIDWSWSDIWRWRARKLRRMIFPFVIRRASPKKKRDGGARVYDISHDDYFKRR